MPREYHGDAVLVARLDALLVADGAAGLDNGGNAKACQRIDVVAEREEGVGRGNQILRLKAHALARLKRALAGQATRVDAVRLARAHANARMVLGDEDGVGLHALAHLPREQQLVHFLVGGLALGRNGEFIRRFGHSVSSLSQNAAVDRAVLNANWCVHAAGTQDAQVLLRLQKLERGGLEARGNDDLDELLVRVHVLDHLERNLDVCRNNAAKSALRVARERLVVSLGDRGGRSRTAGVLMLQNNHGRFVELASKCPARIGIENVVVGKFLAVELLGIHEAMCVGIGQAIERSALMRVFAIAQVLLLLEVKVDDLGRFLAEIGLAVELLVHPGGNRAIVGVRGFEHLQRELRTRLARGGAVVGAHFLKNGIVGGRLGDHGDALEILRSAAQHRRASDVDVLDAGAEIGARGNRLFEGIQVHDHHVDHLDAVLFGFGHVLGIVALREQAAVHHGVQRLHAAVHHFREIRHCIDGRHIDARLGNHLRSAAGRNNLSSEFLVQSARELNHARFVGHRNQNAFNLGVSHVSSSVFLPLTFVYLISRIARKSRHRRKRAKKTCIGSATSCGEAEMSAIDPNSSRASRARLPNNSAYIARRQARQQWRWQARRAFWRQTSNQWGA